MLVAAQFVYMFLNFITYILIARHLGANGFGKISLVISFVWLFNAFVDFGLTELLVREIAGKSLSIKKKYTSVVLGLRIIISAIIYGLIVACSLGLPHLQRTFGLNLILGLALMCTCFTYFLKSIFRAFEKMEYEAASLVVEAVLKILIISAVLKWTSLGVLGVAQGILIASFVTTVFSVIMCQKKFLKLSVTFSKDLFGSLLKKGTPFLVSTLFYALSFKIDVVMVSWMLGDKMTGLFSASVRIVEPMLTFPLLAAVVLFPVISRLSHDSIKNLRRVSYVSLRILLLAGIIMALGLFLGMPYIVSIFFGREFLGSILAGRILSLCLIPFCLKFFLDRFILVIRRPKVMFVTYTVGTFLNILFNLYLIPHIGYAGAAISTLFSEVVIVILNLYWIKRYMPEVSFLELKKEPVALGI